MANLIPERLIDAKVYEGSNDLIGIADVTLPDIEYMTDTISGAGIAGEIESPTIGQYASMTLSLTWRTMNKDLFSLAAAKTYDLDIRAAQQVMDAGKGEYRVQPVKVYAKCLPKKIGLGNAKKASATDSSTELEVTYIKIVVDDKTLVEIDKFNYKSVINGEDRLKEVREALGLN